MKYSVLILGIMLCLAPLAIADEAELPAQKDTYVHEGTPDVNHGGLDYLEVFGDWAHPGAVNPSLTLIRFDLAPYMGKAIDEAILRLYVLPTGLRLGDVDIFRIGDGWDENIVTWNNRPPEDQPPVVTAPMPPNTDEWFEVGVTDFVQNWVNGSVPNHGFYLNIPDQGIEIGARFASKEHPDPGIHPILWLNYHGAGISEVRKDETARLHVSPLSTGAARIEFSLSSATPVTLKVYDAAGTLAETLVDGVVSSGDHTFIWYGAEAGVYFVRFEAAGLTITKKAILLR